MSIQWENIKSEKDLGSFKGVYIDVEKIGSDIVAIIITGNDGSKMKICKKSDYSSTLNLLVPAKAHDVVVKQTVVARKNGDTMQCTRDTISEAEEKKYELECGGWNAEIVETEEVVKIDIISNKPVDFDVPF